MYTPPAYTPPAYLPTAYGVTAYTPPAYLPPAYTPPAYIPPAYTPPAYTPPPRETYTVYTYTPDIIQGSYSGLYSDSDTNLTLGIVLSIFGIIAALCIFCFCKKKCQTKKG